MHSIPLFNKVEILLYSTLISIMSGISRFKARAQHLAVLPAQHVSLGEARPAPVVDRLPGRSISIHWEGIQQTLLTLLLWIVLGFAAGFLIGMLKLR